jgi:nanoRNase/pAp phosphatase (c-di-AMP/oligoRNAs hydrolase)
VKGIEWSVAFGILENSYLVISVRNVGYVRSAGRLVRELFKDIGSAGGHRSAAKAVISLKKVRKLIGKGSQEGIKKWITEEFTRAVSERPDENGQ